MSTVSDIGELELLERIREWTRAGETPPPQGIGDDAALLAADGGRVVVSVDVLVEGVDFDRRYSPLELVGRKAAAANLSDLAAMGARPEALLVALSLAGSTPLDDVAALYRGLQYRAEWARARIIGGDLSEPPAGDRGMTIGVTVLGRIDGKVALRAGAKPGDHLCVTGTIGDAALGLRLLEGGDQDGVAVARQQDPEPRSAAGPELAAHAHAMIDISDGLAADLGHVMSASGVGAAIDLNAVPRSGALRALSPRDAEALILYGGEDYELLLAWPADTEPLAEAGGVPVTKIGEFTSGPGLRVRGFDGEEKDVAPRGWEHFKDGKAER